MPIRHLKTIILMMMIIFVAFKTFSDEDKNNKTGIENF